MIKLWGLGNLVLIWPLVDRIKEKYPHARILFLTFETNRGLLEKHKAVNEVIYYGFTDNVGAIIRQNINLIKRARKEKIDMVINFETFNNTSAVFAYLSQARVRVGLNNRNEKYFYTAWVNNDLSVHISRIFMKLLEPLGITGEYRYPCFKTEVNASEASGGGAVTAGKRFICVHPGTSENFRYKRWPAERFAALMRMLDTACPLPLVCTGGQGEAGYVDNVIKMAGLNKKAVNLAGRLDIWETAGLIKESSVFISADTGPLHIAAALGKNMAVMYGPTSPERYGPLNDNALIFYKHCDCSPCVGTGFINKKCPRGNICMGFSPEQVFREISERFLSEEHACAG
ncbi:MAG: glycosyltransferase family 9 protein [Candidatus Omnitrophota bacterium]